MDDTIVPRLIKAGADLTKVFSYDESAASDLKFASPKFEELLQAAKPKLVIVDPVQAFLGAEIDGHKANEIRPVMSKLRSLAAWYECAVILIEHLNKNIGGKALYRGLGSIDITAAARSVLMLGSDPNNEKEKGIAHIKSNCGEKGKVIGFTISDNGIEWNLSTHLTADMIQGHIRQTGSQEDSALKEAKEFLLEY